MLQSSQVALIKRKTSVFVTRKDVFFKMNFNVTKTTGSALLGVLLTNSDFSSSQHRGVFF